MKLCEKYRTASDQNEVLSLDKNDQDIALQIYTQKYLQYRHFDTIRWQVPGLVGTLGVFILRFGTNQDGSLPPILLIGYGTFALLCGYFLHRLMFHMKSNTLALTQIGNLLGDSSIPPHTRNPKSAAFWFVLFTLAIGLASLGYGLWLLK